MLARRYLISGIVQGVGFRSFVLRQVERIGNLKGFVQNLPDGRVEVYTEGEEKEMAQLEQALRHGPRGGHVEHIEIRDEVPKGHYRDFRVIF